MSKPNGPFHRRGEPGGPNCPLGVLPISGKNQEGIDFTGQLLDAGPDATEVELLRTLASRFGVQWGHDDLGWWAVVRNETFPTWAVFRQDDSGNEFLVEANLTEIEATAMVEDFEKRGHKQTYWCRDSQQS